MKTEISLLTTSEIVNGDRMMFLNNFSREIEYTQGDRNMIMMDSV